MNKGDELLTVWMAAQEKGVHPKSVYRAISEGRLASEKIGKQVMLRRREVAKWKPRQRREQESPARPPPAS